MTSGEVPWPVTQQGTSMSTFLCVHVSRCKSHVSNGENLKAILQVKEKETDLAGFQDVRMAGELRAQLGDLRAKEDGPSPAERRPGFPPAVMRALPLRVFPALLNPLMRKGGLKAHSSPSKHSGGNKSLGLGLGDGARGWGSQPWHY